jgi:hypothetical protein
LFELTLQTNSYSRPIPERPSHGQPPYPGRTIIQNDDQYNLAIPNRNYKPVSPEKPVDRELLKIPPKDTERSNEMGTPMVKDHILLCCIVKHLKTRLFVLKNFIQPLSLHFNFYVIYLFSQSFTVS